MPERRKRKKERKPLRRRIILVSIGVILGLLTVLFFSWVYNPFGQTIEDPLVLIPSDVDFVLCVEDLPELITKLENRDDASFIKSISSDPGLAAFLRDPKTRPWLRDVSRSIRDGLRAMSQQPSLPFDLKFLGDLSGKKLVIAAYAPKKEGDPWPFFCVVQPDSWLGIAGANVLVNRRLGPWFVDGQLKAQGIAVTRSRDAATLRIPSLGRDLHLTRIADAILISSEERQLARIRKAVDLEGIPSEAASRFRSLLPDLGSNEGTDLWLLAKRDSAERLLELKRRLGENWGPETYDLVRRILPRPGGEDLMLRAGFRLGLNVQLTTRQGAAYPGDLFPAFEPHSSQDLRGFLQTVGSFIPGEAFATVYIESTLQSLAEPALLPGGPEGARIRPEPLIDKDHKDLLDSALRSFSVSDFEGLVALMDQALEPRMGLVFFQQPRPVLSDEAEAGLLIAWPVKDRDALEEFLGEVSSHSGKEGSAFTEIRRSRRGGVELIRPTLKEGIVDDPRVTQHGLALVNGYLLYSNFFPFLEEIPQVDEDHSLARSDAVREALGYSPTHLRSTAILDWKALDGYCRQSIPGWAAQQTTPSPITLSRWQGLAQQKALRLGYSVGSPRYRQVVQAEIDRRTRAEIARRSELEREFRTTWDRLKTLLVGASLSVESKAGLLTISLHLDVPRR